MLYNCYHLLEFALNTTLYEFALLLSYHLNFQNSSTIHQKLFVNLPFVFHTIMNENKNFLFYVYIFLFCQAQGHNNFNKTLFFFVLLNYVNCLFIFNISSPFGALPQELFYKITNKILLYTKKHNKIFYIL